MKLINVKKIDASPFQHRKYMDEEKLKELALSIQRDGLIQPIVVRSRNGRFQLIAGERRWRAVRDYTDLKAIEARVIRANDLQARRIAATENLQREDLSAIEKVEYTVDIVDSELIKDKEYASMGKDPAGRVKKLLGSLHSITNSKSRGSQVSKKSELLLNKFIQQLNKIFKNLPKPLKWRSFCENDLPLLVQISQDVREVSIRNQLNRSQTRALETLKQASSEEFHRVAGSGNTCSGSITQTGARDPFRINLKDLSAREIEDIAEKAVKTERQTEIGRDRIRPSSTSTTICFMMSRLNIPMERISSRLKKNWRTVKKYSENHGLVISVRNCLKKGEPVHKVAKEMECPEPLIWSIVLEGKTDQERFQALG